MSSTTHGIVDGRLLQINKPFSQLKKSQKRQIHEWLFLAYSECFWDSGRLPSGDQDNSILDTVCSKIKDAGIWIPRDEVLKYYHSKKSEFLRRYKREAE